ncbi:MAG: dihydroorotate dehydrogenase electron transfer subunit [Planctomycetota bacterium]|nr:dihydroorotate dehydrogenase electron transfer subunit [Planctomycetota bacterium]
MKMHKQIEKRRPVSGRFLGKCVIEANEPQGGGAWLLRAAVPAGEFHPQPGQFVAVRVSDGSDPLLRRPFSICNYSVRPATNAGVMDLLYKVVGRGTKMLTRLRRGEELDLLGPLGHGFAYPRKKSVCVLVGGGMGIAPLVLLARRLAKLPFIGDRRRVVVLFGARTKSEIYCTEELSDYGVTLKVATEDGSLGMRGTVLDLLTPTLRALRPKPQRKWRGKKGGPDRKPAEGGLRSFAGERIVLFSCGPTEMLKRVGRLAVRHSLPCQVSLETRMACGMGACRGCVIPVGPQGRKVTTYASVCKDGPVFEWARVADALR